MNRSKRLIAWVLGSALFGFFALGGFAYELFIGLDWTAYPFGSTACSMRSVWAAAMRWRGSFTSCWE